MNSLILCTAVTLNIFSAPAGNQVVGTVPANKEVNNGGVVARLGVRRQARTRWC